MSRAKKQNRIEIKNGVGTLLIVSKGIEHTALFDEEDIEIVQRHVWSLDNLFYCKASDRSGEEKRTISLHRLILKAKEGQIIDHINRNPSDNRKRNLRFVSSSDNKCNQKIYSNNRLGYSGIYENGSGFIARISYKGKRYNVGTHPTYEKALRARKKAEKVYWTPNIRTL